MPHRLTSTCASGSRLAVAGRHDTIALAPAHFMFAQHSRPVRLVMCADAPAPASPPAATAAVPLRCVQTPRSGAERARCVDERCGRRQRDLSVQHWAAHQRASFCCIARLFSWRALHGVHSVAPLTCPSVQGQIPAKPRPLWVKKASHRDERGASVPQLPTTP